jgi:hypothetical protein
MPENDIAPELSAIEVGASEAVSSMRATPRANFNPLWIGQAVAGAFPQGKILVLAQLTGVAGGAVLLLPTLNNAFFLTAFALFLYNVGESSFGVNMQTTRQAVTPMHLMGRMDTAMRFCFNFWVSGHSSPVFNRQTLCFR